MSERDKTATRTFRLNSEYEKVLKEEAAREGVSLSALMNRILRRYAHAQRWFNRYGSMVMAPRMVADLLEKIPDEDVAEVGRIAGATIPREGLLMMGMPLSFESVMWLIDEIYDSYNRWFQCNHIVTKTGHILHLRHSLGRKWSLFLDSYVSSMIRSLLEIDVGTEVHPDSTTFYISKEKLKAPEVS